MRVRTLEQNSFENRKTCLTVRLIERAEPDLERICYSRATTFFSVFKLKKSIQIFSIEPVVTMWRVQLQTDEVMM